MIASRYKNKLKCKKGQLAPFFIALLVVLIIMAMVNVNLSKVGLVKTDSANAVDAGALAAGSQMAYLFNRVARINQKMLKDYQDFKALMKDLFKTANEQLTQARDNATEGLNSANQALGKACPDPCDAIADAQDAVAYTTEAIKNLDDFIKTTEEIKKEVIAFHDKQYDLYRRTRQIARQSRENAIRDAYVFAFNNSSISSKLKTGTGTSSDQPQEILPSVGDDEYNYKNKFSEFIKSLGHESEYTYTWHDGQGRAHSVKVTVQTQEVGTFDLTVAELTLEEETDLLDQSIANATTARDSLIIALEKYIEAVEYLNNACGCKNCCSPDTPGCCACWKANCSSAEQALEVGMAANEAALAAIEPIFGYMEDAEKGLEPKDEPFRSTTDGDAQPYIIYWMVDIIHDRLVRVDTTQKHEGTDLGLWQTRYPDTSCYSIASFNYKGTGSIYEPKLEFDVSIIETDTLSGSQNNSANEGDN